MSERIEIWDLRFPNAAAQGLPFGRGRLNATERLLVHAAPATLRVDVYDQEGRLLARGVALERTADTPIARLTRHGDRIARQDVWPGPADIGTPVLLAGGRGWNPNRLGNDAERQQWRWSIELYNHI